MSILEKIISPLAPFDCLGCGLEGALLCHSCSQLLSPIPPRCYRCRKLSPASLTCQPCRRVSRLKSVRVCTDYDYVAKELVGHLKFSGAQSAATIMASRLALLINRTQQPVIVPVPTATSRVRQRGYDQAKLIARQLAAKTGLVYSDSLIRSGQSHQVGASRPERLRQLQGAFRVRQVSLLTNQTVILVDDVVTTGATIETAAAALKKSGTKSIEALAFAQA